MTKTFTEEVQRKNAERQLFSSRRTLEHLVQLYDSGQWKNLYKEDTFADAVLKKLITEIAGTRDNPIRSSASDSTGPAASQTRPTSPRKSSHSAMSGSVSE